MGQRTHTKLRLHLEETGTRETSVDPPQLMIQLPKGIKRLSLDQNASWTFGGSKMKTIRLNALNVSRHQKLEIVQEQRCYWGDLNSQNGSLVNGQNDCHPAIQHGYKSRYFLK